jgi:aspartyl/asparaginyl-tRNA synthetase
MNDLISPEDFHGVVSKLRYFFEQRGFVEVHTQSRKSILAACEDPKTIATYHYDNEIWPLPQTGQMWLEHELLSNPESPGFFCITTSYRQEPNPIPGRHNTMFPMFEFETKGSMGDLYRLERDLMEHMGFGARGSKYSYVVKDYEDLAREYGVKELQAEHEEKMWKDYGDIVFLQNFPIYTSPFWNMKTDGNYANKIDVIACGQETVGSAERSTDPDRMRELFYTISNGMYAEILFDKFGKERVEKELEEFLSFDFFPRFGAGIGVTRMIRAMKCKDKMNERKAA